ncbi:FAD-dependent thymidylate synthase [Caldiplasma sukawensis]
MKENNFSNTNRDIFLISLNRQIDRGALMSRYSRTASIDLRDLYETEFAKNPDRGKDFYKRVFLEYGDESIAELMNFQIGLQNLSNISTKWIEESRIGLSYLEKSSRYVRYDRKFEGRYLYIPIEKTGISERFRDEYERVMNSAFEFYSSVLNTFESKLDEKYGKDMIFEMNDENAIKAMRTAIRSRALDDAREILPIGTLTNLGINGNARALSYMIMRLYSSEMKELKSIADMLYSELENECGPVLSFIHTERGKSIIEKMKKTRLAPETEDYGWREREVDVKLLDLHSPFDKLPSIEGLKPDVSRESGIDRRAKLPRSMEMVTAVFSVVMDYGTFREFQRHRFFNIIRGRVDINSGYHVPELFCLTDKKPEYESILNDMKTLYEKICKENGEDEAQYVLPLGTMYRVVVGTNLRELVYFSELRTTPQAHPVIRRVAQEMVKKIIDVRQEYNNLFVNVDWNNYPLGRFSQEYRKEKKLKDM